MSGRYVIAGAPCSGKTTLINKLSDLGYETVPEAARYIIKKNMANSGPLPWTDKIAFQKEVLRLSLEWESKIRKTPAFIDCGIPSGIAYLKKDNIEIFDELKKHAVDRGYELVFLVKPLPNYEKDSERKEDKDEISVLHELIKKTYAEMDYRIVEIPVAPVSERVEMVLSHIKTKGIY